jgi:hypothetical protein
VDHNIHSCSCIHLAFNFFTSKERPHSVKNKPLRRFKDPERTNSASVIADKVFFAGIEDKGYVYLKVINRLEPSSRSRCLAVLEVHPEGYVDAVATAACEHLLAVVIGGGGVGKASLWHVQDETWLADLDIHMSAEEILPFACAMSRNLLAITATRDFYDEATQESRKSYETLFWQVNTSQPTAKSSQFLTSVDAVCTESWWTEHPNPTMNVQMNERWICEWPERGNELRFMKKDDILSGIQGKMAPHAQNSGDLWRRLKLDTGMGDEVYISCFCLEPGNSSRVAVETALWKDEDDDEDEDEDEDEKQEEKQAGLETQPSGFLWFFCFCFFVFLVFFT